MTFSKADSADIQVLQDQLGRIPRGVVGIAARCKCGKPQVVATAPRLADGTPFPTTFYLTHPAAVRGCSTLEAEHLMEEFNSLLGSDPEVAAQYEQAHLDYIARRKLLGEVPEISQVSAGGMPQRVKCLHALVGHTLAVGVGINPVGDLALENLTARGIFDTTNCYCS